MSKELAAVYAQVYGLCLDLSVLEFTDYKYIDWTALKNNFTRIDSLANILLPSIICNNQTTPSGLTLELCHLLTNARKTCAQLLNKNMDIISTCGSRCMFVCRCEFIFYGGNSAMLDLQSINSIDAVFRKLNTIFYCMASNATLPLLDTIFKHLGILRGIAPIPPPSIYMIGDHCLQCIREHEYLPNQGLSKDQLLENCRCSHLFPLVQTEPLHLADSESSLGHEHQSQQSPPKNITTPIQHTIKFNIFNDVSRDLAHLSNLLYWTSGDSNYATSDVSCSHLSQLFHKESRHILCHQGLSKICTNFINKYTPTPFEQLFTGVLHTDHSTILKALTDDCTASFLQKTNYIESLKSKNELYTALQMFLNSDHTIKHTKEQVEGQDPTCRSFAQDAQKRKESYLKKITNEGLKKLSDCLNSQLSHIEDTLSIRSWGTLLYEQFARLYNHFIIRTYLLSQPSMVGEILIEHSQYIKGVLYNHTLNKSHIITLASRYYKILTGPLIKEYGLFRLPQNVLLAQSLAAAGTLPHQKARICFDIDNMKAPKDWIAQEFNCFYTFQDGLTLEEVQEKAWKYIKELILSVAIYNIVWEKNLTVQTPNDFDNVSHFKRLQPTLNSVILTFESSSPLILIAKNELRVFKDIYAMLFCHLYM